MIVIKIVHRIWNKIYLPVYQKFKIVQINLEYSQKPAHAVTSIKQSPALKSHLFLVLS
jgi:hypothetical protein